MLSVFSSFCYAATSLGTEVCSMLEIYTGGHEIMDKLRLILCLQLFEGFARHDLGHRYQFLQYPLQAHTGQYIGIYYGNLELHRMYMWMHLLFYSLFNILYTITRFSLPKIGGVPRRGGT